MGKRARNREIRADAERQAAAADPRFGPPPPEGWHRGIPGLRIARDPAKRRTPSCLEYTANWSAEDEDNFRDAPKQRMDV